MGPKVSEKDIESANTVSDKNLFIRENSDRDHWEDGTMLSLYENCRMADDVPRDEGRHNAMVSVSGAVRRVSF